VRASEPTARLFTALALLTFATGVVDAASVLDLGHVFTANMTGNVVFLGFRLAGRESVSLVASACALSAFLAGAAIGGRMSRQPGRFRVVIGLEAAMLLAAAFVAVTLGDTGSLREVLVALLASAMGMQNAAVRRLGVADMTTTVLTLTLTGLAADSRLAGGASPHIGRRVASVLLMLSGALLGAWLLQRNTAWTFAGAAVVVSLAWAAIEPAPPGPRAPTRTA
jgi:uncharacterized membrane protein YoaK (UPF0700 family)